MSGQAVMSARERLTALFDADTFVETDRLMQDAGVVTGFGYVDGVPVYAYAQDRAVVNGAIGCEQAAKIAKVYELAAQNGAPLVAVFDSDGARLGEGVDAMDAIADILRRSHELSGVVPQIAVVAGACVGSAALIAAAADVVIRAEEADYYLTVGTCAEADITVCCDKKAIETAREVLSYLPQNNLAAPAAFECTAGGAATGDALAMTADGGSLLKLSACTAFARLDGAPCGMVTLSADTLEEECAAAARFVRVCDAFSLPVVTFVDAAGFCCLNCAAKLSQAYAEITAPKVTVITGRAYGAVYIALAGKSAGADAVLAWPAATISPLAPETAVELLWQDRLAAMTDPATERAALAKEYAATECAVAAAAEKGWVSDVVEPAETREKLIAYLTMLAGKRVTHLPRKHANIRL
ncbi:MAG: carboxyl transferase [Ruminococcaceae bacterium]|nr:carboxyl transferase [Oscillospiraceae bacterium]